MLAIDITRALNLSVIRNKEGKETIVKVPDGSTTDLQLPEGGTVSIRHEPDPASGGRQPSGTPSEISNSPSSSPGSQSEISNLKSQISANRAAAEWVLSQPGDVHVQIITIADGQRHVARTIANLPTEPFRVDSVQLVESPAVDAAALARHLGALESLQFVALQHSPHVKDDVVAVLSQMPELMRVNLLGTGVTAQGIIALVTSRPIPYLFIDARQFSAELIPLLEQMPSLQSFSVLDASDEQLRQTFRLKQLTETGLALNFGLSSDLRHSTCARLADELPNLRSMYIDNVRFDDADLAAIARLPHLENLVLSRLPAVTNAGLSRLASDRQLKVLQVGVTAVTALGLANFLEAQPACQVVWDGADRRAVAEWVLSVGGKVQVAGRGAEWFSRVGPAQRRPTITPDGSDEPDAGGPALEASLSHPTNPVLLTGVDLSGLATLQDADLARLADCTTLRECEKINPNRVLPAT